MSTINIENEIETFDKKEIIINGRKRFCYFIKCSYCNTLHFKAQCELLRGIKRNKIFCCSATCRNKLLSKGEKIYCTQCKLELLKTKKLIEKSKTGNFFCNRSCSATYNNSKYPRKIKLAKLIKIKSVKPKIIHKCISCEITLVTKRKYCDICKISARSDSSKQTWSKIYFDYISKWKSGKISGKKGKCSISDHIRRYLFEKYESKCSECGWSKINTTTNKIPLEIDHIDGNWSNHNEDNLRLICASCHSLTPTFRSLNKGQGRTNRKYI